MTQKKLKNRFIILIILLILAFCLWIAALVHGKASYVFLSMLPLVAVVIGLRIVKEQYDRNGFYSERQAAAFYRACEKDGIRIAQENEPLWRPVYEMTVGALPYADLQRNTKHVKNAFARGKNITERKENNT